MATTIGDLAVRVGADTTGLVKGLSESQSKLEAFGAKARSGATDMAKYGAAATAAGAALATAFTVKGLQAVDAQAKLARSLGASIDGLRALQIASGDAGVSASVLETSIEKLNSRIGEAMRGTGTAADSFKRLGLSAEQLDGMDVDQRMAAIADRMQEMGLSAAEAGDELRQMGIRNGEMVNLMLQGGDAIRSANQEVKDLGLSLSAVDAAQVEAANDSFSRFGMMLEGVQQQMAVEVAPVLDAISKMLVGAAKDAGGFGEAASDAFGFAVDAGGFLMDMVEGIKRTFEVAGKGVALFGLGVVDVMLTAANAIVNKPIQAVNELIAAFNELPGVNIEPVGLSDMGKSIARELQTVRDAQEIAMQDIHETMMRPMPSGQFKAFVAESREAAEIAAGEALKINTALTGGQGEGGDRSGRADSQKAIEEKLERIRESNMSEMELLREKLSTENEIINEAREGQLITQQEWEALMRGQKSRHEDAMTDIEKDAADARTKIAEAEAQAKEQALGNALKNLSTLMNTESRKMFEVGKAAALAGAIIDGYAAITGAYKVGASIGGPALGAAYGAAAGAATFAQIQNIRGAQFGSGGGATGAAATGSVTGGINAGGEAVRGQQESSRNLFVQGIDPNQMFSGRQLVELINEAQQDGAQLRVGTA